MDLRSRQRVKLKTDTLIGFILCHSLALLALFPWFFSWTGVALLAAGMYVFGVLGINLGFHRLLAHRSFSCPLWLEHSLAFLGTCCLQFSPAFWVAVHRRHHRFADEERDPHSPLKSFFWAHFGWLLVRTPDMRPGVMTERYAKDLMRDPFYAMIERRKNWMKITFLSWVAFFVLGFVGDLLAGASSRPGVSARRQPLRLGRRAAHGAGLAHHLVGQFRNPCLGLSELRDARPQPQQSDHRPAGRRRRLAQQPPRRPHLGAPWP